MYDAMDIAEYVLDYCANTLKHPIDNLYLQKFLYYIQGEYLTIYGEPIFDNDIVLSEYGIFIPDVYYSYNNYGTCDITDIKQTVLISNETKETINKIVKSLINISIWEIIKRIKQEPPYRNNHIEGYNGNDNIVVPMEDIKEYFCYKNKLERRCKIMKEKLNLTDLEANLIYLFANCENEEEVSMVKQQIQFCVENSADERKQEGFINK